ncbi:hypothetical protein TWF481_004730 [Arthrobotrys musiformis]|uniref:Uncharacterized protein n=1 Tax=Arthrobotrys musiformis TaxID=47236 RepID=A0AAV9WMJ3_9PEZI
MDPTHINNAQAREWQQNEEAMVQKSNEDQLERDPTQLPVPLPEDNLFFNAPNQGMNLNTMPLNRPVQYQQLVAGDIQMGVEVFPPMQTPMDSNTGIFLQNPLPVQKLFNNPSGGMEIDLDTQAAKVTSLALPKIPERLAVPSLEGPKFHPLGLPPFEVESASVRQGRMGAIPDPPAPARSLFMQPMNRPKQTQVAPSAREGEPLPPTPPRRVRFQGFGDFNAQGGNLFTPNKVTSMNENAARGRPQTVGYGGAPGQRLGTKGTPASVPQVPKAVVQISEEPFSRTFPSNPQFEDLKTGREPPENGQYPGGRMTVGDFQESRSNMVYLGKPTGEAKDRIPAPLKDLGEVPQFKGNPDDIETVKEYLNILTTWTNAYVHTTRNTVWRYDTHTEKLTRQVKSFEREKKRIEQAIKQVNGEGYRSIPEFILSTKLEKEELQETINLAHHPTSAPKDVKKAKKPVSGMSVLEFQKDLAERRKVEVQTLQGILEIRGETITTLEADLKQARELITIYQVQIQEMVNKENFNSVEKIEVLQRLVDTREAARDLEMRYNKLFTKARELYSDIRVVKIVAGWVKGIPKLSGKEHEDKMKQNLEYRCQTLFENCMVAVRDNARLEEQVKGEKSISELQAEYDALKAKRDDVQKLTRNAQEFFALRERVKKMGSEFAEARESWDEEKKQLRRDRDYAAAGRITSERREKQLEKELNEELKRVERAGATIKDLRKDLEGWKAANGELRKWLDTRTGELKSVRETGHYLNKELDKAETMNREYSKELAASKAQYEECSKELATSKAKYETCAKDKKTVEGKARTLIDIHQGVVAENAKLKERRAIRKLEIEALNKRLRENGPEKIIRIEGPEANQGKECLLTKGELMQFLGQPDFRDYMLSYLKAVGHIKDGEKK